jgi:hypothetical protein
VSLPSNIQNFIHDPVLIHPDILICPHPCDGI